MLERGEVRTELLKELERQQQKLLARADVPGVDMALIDQLRGQLKSRSSALMAAPRLGQCAARRSADRPVRQRLNIPGGCCSFDLPTLHMWMHAPQQDRDADVATAAVAGSAEPCADHGVGSDPSVGAVPQSNQPERLFPDNAEGADLLRLRLHLAPQLYPQISGHKTRYAIRFLPLDSENGVVPERLTFELACC